VYGLWYVFVLNHNYTLVAKDPKQRVIRGSLVGYDSAQRLVPELVPIFERFQVGGLQSGRLKSRSTEFGSCAPLM